jgi:hypothetical protein
MTYDPGTILTKDLARSGMQYIEPSNPNTPPSNLSLHATISSPQYMTSTISLSHGSSSPWWSQRFTPGGTIRNTPLDLWGIPTSYSRLMWEFPSLCAWDVHFTCAYHICIHLFQQSHFETCFLLPSFEDQPVLTRQSAYPSSRHIQHHCNQFKNAIFSEIACILTKKFMIMYSPRKEISILAIWSQCTA